MAEGWKKRGAFLLAGIMLFGGNLTAFAEEEVVTPKGDHVYDVQEDEASDTWYAAARGAYLVAGVSKVLQYDSTHVVVSATTFAHQDDCKRVFARAYLDESSDGGENWHTLDYWTDERENAGMAHVSCEPYKITRYYYYSAQGAHSVTRDGVTEATNTCTDGIQIY